MKTKKLSPRNQVRKAATEIAVRTHDKLAEGRPCRMMEVTFAKAVDRKLEQDPGFGWTEAAR